MLLDSSRLISYRYYIARQCRMSLCGLCVLRKDCLLPFVHNYHRVKKGKLHFSHVLEDGLLTTYLVINHPKLKTENSSKKYCLSKKKVFRKLPRLVLVKTLVVNTYTPGGVLFISTADMISSCYSARLPCRTKCVLDSMVSERRGS